MHLEFRISKDGLMASNMYVGNGRIILLVDNSQAEEFDTSLSYRMSHCGFLTNWKNDGIIGR